MDDRPPEGSARGLSDVLLLGLGSLLAAGLGLLTVRLLLAGLSEADYGRYRWFVAAFTLLGVGVSWPLPGVLRLGADEATRRGGRLGGTAASLGLLVALSGALVAVPLLLLPGPVEARAGVGAVPWLLGIVLLLGAGGLFQELLKPAGLVRWRTLASALARAATLTLLALASAREGGLRLELVYALTAAGAAAGLLAPALGLLRRLGGARPDPATLRRALGFGGPVLVRLLGVAGLATVDVFVIERLRGPDDVGRYDLAYQVAEQVVVFGFVLEHLAGPLLAGFAARADEEGARRYLRAIVPELAWAWSLGAALLIPLAGPILGLLRAPSPEVSVPLLQLLALGVAVRGVTLLENPLLDAHLLSAWPTAFLLLALALNAALDLLLIGPLGLTGPALASVLAFALQALLRGLYLRRRFGAAAGWRPHLGLVWPALVLLGVRALGGGALPGLAVWAVAAALALAVGRPAGLFTPELLPLLERVRMPGPLRRLLLRLHAPRGPA